MAILRPTAEVCLYRYFIFVFEGKISKMSSLFTYDSTSLLENYNSPPVDRPAFVPAFSLPENPDDPLVTNTLTMCSGEGVQFCKYDTLSTRSLAVGNSTLRAFHNHLALVKGLEPGNIKFTTTPGCHHINQSTIVKGKCFPFFVSGI